MDIVFNSCCGASPQGFFADGKHGVYIQCPVCKRTSSYIPVIGGKYLDRIAAEACARRWNER